jgi:hypothetical protein
MNNFELNERVIITIHDAWGKPVYATSITVQSTGYPLQQIISAGDISSGFYIISVQSHNGVQKKKVLHYK